MWLDSNTRIFDLLIFDQFKLTNWTIKDIKIDSYLFVLTERPIMDSCCFLKKSDIYNT